MKRECYVFDFAPTRALWQIADYSCSLHPDQTISPEQSVGEFIHFLPVLAYDGSSMKQVDATDVLDNRILRYIGHAARQTMGKHPAGQCG